MVGQSFLALPGSHHGKSILVEPLCFMAGRCQQVSGACEEALQCIFNSALTCLRFYPPHRE
jgi:hypothetical protein